MSEMLSRSVPFELRAAGEDGDGLTLDGYAAVFDTFTEINSWEGKFHEQVKRGAFRKSITETTPVLQFDHGRHPLVGSIPIGAIDTLREDKAGLHVRARLHDNWMVQPVRDAIASESITGMSFRFQVMKDEWRDTEGKKLTPAEVDRLMFAGERVERTLLEVKVAELGPVVFPAYTETSVGVRTRELAAALTDPEVRADLARILVGTPTTSSEPEGDSGEAAAATPAPEPRTHSVHIPSPSTRERALRLKGVIQ